MRLNRAWCWRQYGLRRRRCHRRQCCFIHCLGGRACLARGRRRLWDGDNGGCSFVCGRCRVCLRNVGQARWRGFRGGCCGCWRLWYRRPAFGCRHRLQRDLDDIFFIIKQQHHGETVFGPLNHEQMCEHAYEKHEQHESSFATGGQQQVREWVTRGHLLSLPVPNGLCLFDLTPQKSSWAGSS